MMHGRGGGSEGAKMNILSNFVALQRVQIGTIQTGRRRSLGAGLGRRKGAVEAGTEEARG